MTKIIHKDLSYKVRGVLIDVHNSLGPGLPEKFYQMAVITGLTKIGISCESEKNFEVYYRGQCVGLFYVDVWLKSGKMLLELKVAPHILAPHKSQALSYLKVTNADLAIVANFGTNRLEDLRLPNFIREKVVESFWQEKSVEMNLPFRDLTNRVLEACYQVHTELGPGFVTRIYRRATMVELHHQGIKFEYIKKLPITYQENVLGMQTVHLILVEDTLLLATVAIKNVTQTTLQTRLQARLKHTGHLFGLLVNFCDTILDIKTVQTKK